MVKVSPLAVVEKGAELDEGVVVEPFAFIGSGVSCLAVGVAEV